MKLLFVKGDDVTNVRLSKYIDCYGKDSNSVEFWGWDRRKLKIANDKLHKCQYLLSGGGFGNKLLLLYYPIWMFLLFIKSIKNLHEGENIIAINFDSAFPVFCASLFRRIEYIYEIHDEFGLSYRFPMFIKKMIMSVDHLVMKKARVVVHVDKNRVNYKNCTSVIIENSPLNAIREHHRNYDDITSTFAVIGNISKGRGIDQILKFAQCNVGIRILLVGKFYDVSLRKRFAELKNVVYYNYMSQDKLFVLLKKCCGIFSLYDPSLEINRLAASNKVYDAMMLGIPVITNKEVLNSSFIQKNQIGIIVDYEYNETWKILNQKSFIDIAKKMGGLGREIYLNNYQFDVLVNNRLTPYLIQ